MRTKVIWTVRERTPSGLWVARARGKNVMTSYGLTALASAFGGTYAQPLYLVIDNGAATVLNGGGISAGATSVLLSAKVDQAGDTALVLGVGDASQEQVSFSAVTNNGDGTYTYTMSACANNHASGQYVVRAVRAADTLASVTSEVQYDATNAPGKRAKSSGWFSGGTGNGVMQFFVTGSQALTRWQTIGLSESANVGAGSLHNHLVLGYNHTSGNDTQVDISLTITN